MRIIKAGMVATSQSLTLLVACAVPKLTEPLAHIRSNTMDRITNSDLEGLVRVINKLTNSPQDPYYWDENKKLRPNGNCYHLSGAYGGVSLHRMCNDGSTGIHDVFSCGHQPKRDLYNRMRSFIVGLEVDK